MRGSNRPLLVLTNVTAFVEAKNTISTPIYVFGGIHVFLGYDTELGLVHLTNVLRNILVDKA